MACDLANITEIESITIQDDNQDRLKLLNAGRDPESVWWKRLSVKWLSSNGNSAELEVSSL